MCVFKAQVYVEKQSEIISNLLKEIRKYFFKEIKPFVDYIRFLFYPVN